MPIPVIDLFAGPGGLGEGFSSLLDDAGERMFKIKLSIEMDEQAHRTLELRAFFRQFSIGEAPHDYYDYLARKISREELHIRHPQQAERAWQEAWHAELGGKETLNAEVDERIEVALGNRGNWVLIGGPPCQAYSLVGRSRVIGGEGLQKYENDPRHDLYKHYLRILAVHQPPVFVMENVKGLLSAEVKQERIFERILADLKNPAEALRKMPDVEPVQYNLYPLAADRGDLLGEFSPEDFVLRAEEHGVPQARHRIIILGVRSNIRQRPGFLAKTNPGTVEQGIGDLPVLRSGLSKEEDSPEAWKQLVREITEAAWLHNHELGEAITKAIRRIGANLIRGGEFVPGATKAAIHTRWFFDRRLGGVCNHKTRGHIQKDLHRYLFAAVFAQVKGRSPLLEDFPRQLLPHHENVQAALTENKFNDRFRVQIAGRPSTTVVSHISKDGHYYIHYDPSQCRSLTVREAARLQTFPDNYLFEGPRTEQYRQVGNAVPPWLARQIAAVVAELFN
jgi:DNA (cytosine-5)-methyltransferase 1